MPWTTTQNTMGAISILMSLMKPSPSGLSLAAKSGAAMPITMPIITARTTWPNRLLKNFIAPPRLRTYQHRHALHKCSSAPTRTDFFMTGAWPILLALKERELCFSQYRKSCPPPVHGISTELAFYPQEPVVLGDAIRTTQRAGFDLCSRRRYREIGDRHILGLPRAVGDHRRVTRLGRHLDCRQGFAQRADLVQLDQNGIRHAAIDALFQDFRIGDEEVVAHKLHLIAEAVGEQFPAVPIALGHTVFDREDRVLLDPCRKVVGELFRS